MASPLSMPKLGMTMREGTVIDWPISPGGRVEKGQTLLVIESEKAEVEIEAPSAGWLRHVYVDVGETVPCGRLLAAISREPDEPFDPEAFRIQHDRPEAPVAPAAGPPAGEAPRAGPRAGARAAVTPAARGLARKLGIAPAAVPGTGPGGRVTRDDVQAFAVRREALVPVADGVALEVLRDGSGEPVLLLPGFGVDVASFARQAPALAEHFRVLGVNPRGVGLSDAPAEDGYGVGRSADDAARVVAEPAHVIGASLGAAVAIELALAHPERVRSLTLVTPFTTADPRLLAVLDAWCEVATAGPEVLARMLLPWLFSRRTLADPRARERTLRGLARSAGQVSPATLRRSAAGLRAWSGTREDALGGIGAPTLVLAAGGDLLTPGGERLAEAIPGARVDVIPEAGHALALDAPEAVARALRAHLHPG